MRAIFCGNFDYEARQSEVERLFRRYGRVEKVDMKSGFAFIYMEDERDAEDAIRALDRTEFGRKGRRLRVEWTKQERGSRRSAGPKRSSNTNRPSKTLFVINFDPYNTRTRDLERHFESYGKIVSVRIRRNFAFVQYDSLEDATRALEATNMSKLMDRVISVEFAVRDDDDQRNGYSPERRRDRSPERGRDRRRSPSPYQRERDSPDYGHGRNRSPYKRERASPDYGRNRSPTNYRKDRGSPAYGRDISQSPYKREMANNENGHGSSRSPQKREKHNPDNGRSRSHSPYDRERASPGNGLEVDHSPSRRERSSPDNGVGRRQSSLPEHRESPYGGAESPIDD